MMYTVTRSADAPTFEEYAGTAWPSLYRYAYLLAGNHADAEDMAQQTLMKAYQSWSRVKGSDSPTAYLRRMLTNTYLSQRRPKARRLELLTDAPARGDRAPPLPQDPPRTQRHRQPLLVAAAIALIVAGAVAVVATPRGGQELGPAPPSPSRTESEPSPSRTEPVVTIPTTAPTVPCVLEQRLYVDGEQVPGTWWSVQVGDAGWLAQRTDNTWWWGRGPEPNEITGWHDVPPVISPNGRYVAHAGIDNGEGVLTGFDTRPGGEGLGSVPIDLGDPQDGSTVFIRAVTNDGKVIAQGPNTSLLWLPLAGNGTVDLTVTAPRQLILGSTAAGLIANDEAGGTEPVDGEPYLAQISDNGELTRISAIPAHDDLMVSPGTGWLAWTPAGTTGGEVTSIPALEAQTVDGTQQVTLTAPAGWGFRVRAWRWKTTTT